MENEVLIFPGKRQDMHGKQTVSMICLGEWKKDRDKADTSYAKKILCNGTLECRMAIRNDQSGFGAQASGDYNKVFKYYG